MKRIPQIDRIYELITELASGNLSFRADTSENNDELDAITVGINMLAEELQSTTVSKEFLNRIYRGVVDMLIVMNPDKTIQAVNSTVCRLLGYEEEELLDEDFSTLLMRSKGASMERVLKELDKKGYCYDIERTFRTRKGKAIPVSLSCSLLQDSTGGKSGVLLIAKDISRIKKTEEQLRIRNKELSSFIYRVSHDIKGPLSSILGLTYLAKSDMDDHASTGQYIDLIEQSANRLDKVIGDFLELGRITQSRTNSSVVHISQMVQEILRSHEFIPDYNEVDVKVNDRYTGTFKTKKILLKAILQNIIDNAVKYRRKDGERAVVDIEADNKDNGMVIRIHDNGIGMDKEIMDHIFSMFFKGSERSKGSGLGLYIVKTSVEALKGAIEVKSRKGEGTHFTIRIPNRAR